MNGFQCKEIIPDCRYEVKNRLEALNLKEAFYVDVTWDEMEKVILG